MPKMLKNIHVIAIAASIGTFAAISPAHAANCTYAVGGIDKKGLGVISAKAIAAKKKTACKRARARCERRLQRARKRGKVPGGRTKQCRRL